MRTASAFGFSAVAGVALSLGSAVLAQPTLPITRTQTRMPAAATTPAQSAAKARAMIEKSIAYFRAQQDAATGGWAVNPKGPNYPAITGLIVHGMLLDPAINENDQSVQQGLKFIYSYAQPDGGVYDRILPSYNTAICMIALSTVQDPRARELVGNGQKFLKGLQFGEDAVEYAGLDESARPVESSHPFYGGWGYGRHGRPDLSNANWTLEALSASGLDKNDPAFKRALVFLQRIQMQETSDDGVILNDEAYAKGSSQGGFIYATSVNKDRQGIGQSNAGEIFESFSEGPGTSISVAFKPGADAKPTIIQKADIETRLKAAFERSIAAESVATKPKAEDQFVVALGISADGLTASTFTIRTSIQDAAQAQKFVAAALQGIAVEPELSAETVPQWKAVSRLRAYGSMTYAGFKSMIYAGLSREDPRVLAALRWIGENYTLEENPGLGTDGMYYYYVVFARAMEAMGEPTLAVRGADGSVQQRRWAMDLVERLAALQNDDGSFRSVDDRWMENNPVLITAYSLIALQAADKSLRE